MGFAYPYYSICYNMVHSYMVHTIISSMHFQLMVNAAEASGATTTIDGAVYKKMPVSLDGKVVYEKA